MSRPRWIPAAALLMAGAYPAAIVLATRAGDPFGVAFSAAFVVYAVVGLLIAWSRPANAIGHLFVFLALAVPLAVAASGYAYVGLPGARWIGWAGSVPFPIIFGSLLIFLPLLFPTGTFLSARWRRLGIFAAALLVAVAAILALAPGELTCCPGIANPVEIDGLEALAAVLPATFPLVALTAVLAYASLIVRFRRSRGEERLQLKWFTLAVGWICLTTLVGAGNALGVVPDSELAALVAYPSGIAAIGLAVGVAILKHRLYDIDLIINRALVYGGLTATLVAAYLGSVLLLSQLLAGLAGGDQLAVAGSTLAAAALFQPARKRMQATVNRRFYRSRYDAQRTLEVFSSRLRDQIDLDSLTDELQGVARDTMAPASTSVWLRAGEETR